MRIVCNKCKKTVAKGWVCCPYCGQIRVCKKETKILLVIPDEHQVLEGDIVSFFNLIPRKDFPDVLELESIKREIKEFDKYLKRLETEGKEYFRR